MHLFLSEPSVRKKLDSHVLTTHSALSEQEKLLKDPLAKHKQGDGVIVPVPPLKQSSSSSRDADRPHRPVDENLAARDHRATPISALVESSGVQLKAASKVTRPVEPFVLFEDKCHSSQSTSANKSVARPASNGSFALIDDISRNDTFQSKPAAKAAAASVETFSIFEDTSSVNEKTRIAPARSIKKSSITGFDIFCDGSISSKKDSSKVKSVTVPEIVPAFANIEKGKKNTAASNEIGVNRSALKPKRSAGAFDDFDDHEVAYDDTTINTKIAKMDIDAMFFDVEDSDPMPTSRPLDLNMSSSVVFPVTGSIIDARNQLEQPAIKKDGGFVIFDEYSVIKSV